MSAEAAKMNANCKGTYVGSCVSCSCIFKNTTGTATVTAI